MTSPTPLAPSPRQCVDLIASARRLKSLKRAGWAQRGVREPESVAEHSWRVALMTLLAAPQNDANVDAGRAVAIALVHDLAETVVGDITPNDGVDDMRKEAMEREAMATLTEALGARGRDVRALWEEYEAGETEEAKLVKDMDKLEMIMQAQEYENDGNTGRGEDLEEFFESTRGRYRTRVGEAWSEEIERRRPRRE
jgi:putative hydrolase of HD superfamily